MVREAKKRGVNKSDAIRQAYSVLGADAAPKTVVEYLAKKKIEVSPALVCNVRAAANGDKTGKRKVRKVKDTFDLATALIATATLAQSMGLDRLQDGVAAVAAMQFGNAEVPTIASETPITIGELGSVKSYLETIGTVANAVNTIALLRSVQLT